MNYNRDDDDECEINSAFMISPLMLMLKNEELSTRWQKSINDCLLDIVYQLNLGGYRKSLSLNTDNDDYKKSEKVLTILLDTFSNGLIISKETNAGNSRLYRYYGHDGFVNYYYKLISKTSLQPEFHYSIPNLHEYIISLPNLASKMIIDIDFKPRSQEEMKIISELIFHDEVMFFSSDEITSSEFEEKILFGFIVKNIGILLGKLFEGTLMMHKNSFVPADIISFAARFCTDKKCVWVNPYSLNDLLTSIMSIFTASNDKKKSYHIYLPRILAASKCDMTSFMVCLMAQCYLDNPFLLFGIPYKSIHPTSKCTNKFLNDNPSMDQYPEFPKKLWDHYILSSNKSDVIKEFQMNKSQEYSNLMDPEIMDSLFEEAMSCLFNPIIDSGPYTSMRIPGSSKSFQYRTMKLLFPNVMAEQIDTSKDAFKSDQFMSDLLKNRNTFIRNPNYSIVHDIMNDKDSNESFQKFIIRQSIIQSTGPTKCPDEMENRNFTQKKINIWNEHSESLLLCHISIDTCTLHPYTNEYVFGLENNKAFPATIINVSALDAIQQAYNEQIGIEIIESTRIGSILQKKAVGLSSILLMLQMNMDHVMLFQENAQCKNKEFDELIRRPPDDKIILFGGGATGMMTIEDTTIGDEGIGTGTNKSSKHSSMINRFVHNEAYLNQHKPSFQKSPFGMHSTGGTLSQSMIAKKSFGRSNNNKGSTNTTTTKRRLYTKHHYGNSNKEIDYLFTCICASMKLTFVGMDCDPRTLYNNNKSNPITISVDETKSRSGNTHINAHIDIDIITGVGGTCPWKYTRLFCKDGNLDNMPRNRELTMSELNHIEKNRQSQKYSHSHTRNISVRFNISLMNSNPCKITYHCFNKLCHGAEENNKLTKEIKSYPASLTDVINAKLRTFFFSDYLKQQILS